MAALQALGVPEDSLLRNPEQIPHLVLTTPVQSQVEAADDKDTPSMRVGESNRHPCGIHGSRNH